LLTALRALVIVVIAAALVPMRVVRAAGALGLADGLGLVHV